ncbi:class I SAM-dependent methyltransferase [Parafrankia discariae]|uniref:class I SAM-dependent methyltransferase n=1 Tax=Parafrankia discariae TaxID=365528 RepID=UPI0003737208|nr:class I SAM-dependent methyltransferase [Parafrankia discariae]
MPTTSSWQYGRLCSLVYQLDKPIGTSFGDVEFYTELLDGVTGEILEPAVGTGRLIIPLTRSGLRVRGYDVSEYMLGIARENCAAHGVRPDLFVADMVTFREPGTFDAVIVPTGSFALVLGRDDALRALRNIRESLRPGGRLIVDVEPLRPSTATHPPGHWWHGDDLLTLTAVEEVRAAERQLVYWSRYELWRERRLVETELELFTLQMWELDEFSALLDEAGFGSVAVHADYTAARPPRADTAVWTFEATA